MQYKTAIVTGASSGIGESITRQLCEKGVTVYALARNQKKLMEIKKSLPKNIRSSFYNVSCNITDKKSIESAIASINSKDSVDLLINNAGIGYSRDFMKFSDKEIGAVISTNLRGTINVSRQVLGMHKEGQPLQIVNVTSLAGKIGFPRLSVYSATKFALEGLTESLSLEYRGSGVTFTVLRPGITNTAFFDKAGMNLYKEGVKDLNSYYTADKVAQIFISKLERNKKAIVVGKDKVFLLLLPFIPFSLRFKVLDIINRM